MNPKRPRWQTPAYRDGRILGHLWSAEHSLLVLLGQRDGSESEAISEAFSAVTRAIKIVQKRVETRP